MSSECRVTNLRPVCTESFRPGSSLKLGLKPENGFKSYAFKKTYVEFRLKPGLELCAFRPFIREKPRNFSTFLLLISRISGINRSDVIRISDPNFCRIS